MGFQLAGIDSLAAVDSDPAACRDYERLTGRPATCADLSTLAPEELRALCGGRRPDVVFTSPPCKAFSGCLSAKKAKSAPYVAMSDLAFRGVWLVLEAWPTAPPPLLVLENVPRIQSRGARWLEHLTALLEHHGYAVHGSSHDCGELGGLAQRRRRYLLVARHREQVPELLYRPPVQRVRGIGEVLGALPSPLAGEGSSAGPLHRLPKLGGLTWLRLASIPAGRDWRALPAQIESRCARREGSLGVKGWREASAPVIGHARPENWPAGVADPRLGCVPAHHGPYGVESWGGPSHTVIASATPRNAWASVADPRLSARGTRHAGVYGAQNWAAPAHTIIAKSRMGSAWSGVADPRLPHRAARQNGGFGVEAWANPSHAVLAHASVRDSRASVADPRVPEPTHALIDERGALVLYGAALDLGARGWPVIVAPDGTWHRPMTTLELAALQGLPAWHDGRWLELDGGSDRAWRQRIGNAMPVQAAAAIAGQMVRTLDAARSGGLLLSSTPAWVEGVCA